MTKYNPPTHAGMGETMRWIEQAVFLLLILLLVACIAGVGYGVYRELFPPTVPIHGIVLRKHFYPAHMETIYVPVVTGRTTIMVPRIVQHPDRWVVIVLPDGAAPDKEFAVCVTKQRHDALKAGDEWLRDDTVREINP